MIFELGLEIDVLGLVSGSIGIGNVGGHQLLTSAQKIHVALNARAQVFHHDGVAQCNSAAREILLFLQAFAAVERWECDVGR